MTHACYLQSHGIENILSLLYALFKAINNKVKVNYNIQAHKKL